MTGSPDVLTNLEAVLKTIETILTTIAFTIAAIMGVYAIIRLMMAAHLSPAERKENRDHLYLARRIRRLYCLL
jgi:hypothetical protein